MAFFKQQAPVRIENQLMRHSHAESKQIAGTAQAPRRSRRLFCKPLVAGRGMLFDFLLSLGEGR